MLHFVRNDTLRVFLSLSKSGALCSSQFLKATDEDICRPREYLLGDVMNTQNIFKFIFFVNLVIFVLLGCLTKLRTRQFVVEDKSFNNITVDKWIIHAPELRAFYKQAGVNEIPDLDTILFQPLIKVEKLFDNKFNVKIIIDTVEVTFLETGEKIKVLSSSEEPTYTGNWNKEKYQYIYFNKNNNIHIPMEINNILFEFEFKIKDDQDQILKSKLLTFKMKRQEGGKIGFTYGD